VQVKWWNTFNEPTVTALGYSLPYGNAPNILTPGHGQYLVIHTILLSHARAYRLYEREFKDKQGGEFSYLHRSSIIIKHFIIQLMNNI